ncbi:hypothetical protein ZHAS_00017729 [Anopheles sinensis]|uniref:Uncharacterized protein n=1 Tax=Anopheles sinensis TaxID=74873 RepID=A0A084WH30_ANOSI|nr:hypothetical protein ZHAS_00017729 [Anopheles sinensis]
MVRLRSVAGSFVYCGPLTSGSEGSLEDCGSESHFRNTVHVPEPAPFFANDLREGFLGPGSNRNPRWAYILPPPSTNQNPVRTVCQSASLTFTDFPRSVGSRKGKVRLGPRSGR